MKIIAIEGLDKSGKFLQSKLLAERLASQGLTVEQSEFHRYDTPTGKLIMDWLTGKYDVDQLTIELIMTADKQAQQGWFAELERNGVDVLILDRYTTSQYVYSQANGVPTSWTDRLQDHMRMPNFEILIDIPAEVSMARKGKHNNGENDRYESDKQMLTNVRELYRSYVKALMGPHNDYSYGVIVDGEQSIEEIHEQIWQAIQPTIKGEQ